MESTQRNVETAATKACQEIIKDRPKVDIYGLNKIKPPETEKKERKSVRIIENVILSSYIYAWLNEADLVEEMYGGLLDYSFRQRLAKMRIPRDGIKVRVESGREYYPDEELIAAALIYIRGVPVEEMVAKHYRKFEQQVTDINKAPRDDWKALILWRTGEHGESGLTYRLTTIIRTETDTAQCEASADVYDAAKIPCYRYNAMLDDKTCGRCRNLHGRVFRMSEKKPGVNFPRCHPNCRCFIEPLYLTEQELKNWH